MRTLALCVLAGAALSGCEAEKREYEMSVGEVRSKLLASHFEKGILPGYERHRPIMHRDSKGNLEWQVSTTDDLRHPSVDGVALRARERSGYNLSILGCI